MGWLIRITTPAERRDREAVFVRSLVRQHARGNAALVRGNFTTADQIQAQREALATWML
jgi:hypothetical protein